MGERYYKVLAPDMPYRSSKRRSRDCWRAAPRKGGCASSSRQAPTAGDTAYQVEFLDEEQFVRELELLVAPAGQVNGRN